MDKIANLMNINSLPNEDPLVFEGSKLKVFTQKITEKNTCTYFLCSYGARMLDSSPPAPSNQPKVYHVALNTFNDNPYSSDASY